MTLTSKPLAVIVVLMLFGGIFFSSLMGWWETESTKKAAVYTEGEFAGQANPADIRGSYTFGDVENNFSVPVDLLAQAFGVETDNPAAYQVKLLEEQFAGSPVEIGTASVRLFVAFYLNLPFELTANIYLPQSAADILQARPLSNAQRAYLSTHIASAAEAAPAAAQPTHAPAAETGDTTIKGKTTFTDLLNWGLPPEKIEEILGVALPDDRMMKVKDFCGANGLAFEVIKTALQAALDELQ